MPAAYRVYVLQNPEGRFYIGLSEDVRTRVDQHNLGDSKWTRGKGPWKLVWESEGMNLSQARKMENRLKRQGRGKGFYAITSLQRRGGS
jgi:putative endonuclease